MKTYSVNSRFSTSFSRPRWTYPIDRDDINDLLILKHKVKVERFGQHRVLGSERDGYLF
ncbi:MAG: hypothetical protein MZV70_30415 [Desulfobacterales bacterium]|nr:hypothetical protein [Desulfobacterales bacterium]